MTDKLFGDEWVDVSSCLSDGQQTANVVPNSSWTAAELQDFADKYPNYTKSIILNNIVPAGLFDGIIFLVDGKVSL